MFRLSFREVFFSLHNEEKMKRPHPDEDQRSALIRLSAQTTPDGCGTSAARKSSPQVNHRTR